MHVFRNILKYDYVSRTFLTFRERIMSLVKTADIVMCKFVCSLVCQLMREKEFFLEVKNVEPTSSKYCSVKLCFTPVSSFLCGRCWTGWVYLFSLANCFLSEIQNACRFELVARKKCCHASNCQRTSGDRNLTWFYETIELHLYKLPHGKRMNWSQFISKFWGLTGHIWIFSCTCFYTKFFWGHF